MILPKLIRHHLKHGDDLEFFKIQAKAALEWVNMESRWPGNDVLDLGCGNGLFGDLLDDLGCWVVYGDVANLLPKDGRLRRFVKYDLNLPETWYKRQYNFIICSNVLEHLKYPKGFLLNAHKLLAPGGVMYLSWTNWLSPWGGHEFSPFHYLGYRRGHLVWDKLIKRKRIHTPEVNLFHTTISGVLKTLRKSGLGIHSIAPRYYTELWPICYVPVVREFLTWNCAVLLYKKA